MNRVTTQRKVVVRKTILSSVSERSYSLEELVFMREMQAEKERLATASLTPVQILRVAHKIGYRKMIDLREVNQRLASMTA